LNNPNPHTLAGWLDFRTRMQAHLDQLDLPTLAVVYGVSHRIPYADPRLSQEIRQYIERTPDAVYTRFILAYHSAAYYFDISSSWGWGLVEDEPGSSLYRSIPEGQPGWIAPPPPEYIEQIKEWLVEGIRAFRSDPGRMQLIHWIKFRALMGDTFLDMDDITPLETALGYTISAEPDNSTKELARHILQNLEHFRNSQEDSHSPGDSELT
jgi:hypothetical protein